MKLTFPSLWVRSALLVAFLAVLVSGCQPVTPTAVPVAPYMRMNPPPDSDKPLPVPAGDNSCWMHNAANMLAGAGYGAGTTVQARADDIFADMNTQYGTANGGWPSAALQWWLASANNTWTTNPYTVVTVYGGTGCAPWANTNGARDIGNELRNGNMAGLAIRWPLTGPGCNGGHAITPWGDDSTSVAALTANPGGVRVTNSDTDVGGDVQAYTYDAYTNPNPGGTNEGNGWYFNYGGDHPYIIDIVTLGPTTGPSGPNAVRVTGSYRIQQTSELAASDLHYRVGTDVDILTYRTWLDWPGTPTITESQPRRELTVDWVFSGKKVPKDTWVTISTEFVEPSWNSISYHDVHFTYPDWIGVKFPDLVWRMESPLIDKAESILNVTGGYIIGSFDVSDPKTPDAPAVRYRFVHQYLYNQSPEFHTFLLSGTKGFIVTNLLFGHSYGYPTEQELWQFENWMTKSGETYTLSEEPVKIIIDWKGQLPYPEGLK
jgi:hypothetical protein